MKKDLNFATGYDVSDLPEYIKVNTDEILTQLYMGAPSLDYFKKQLGVKGTVALNIMTLDPTIACGTSCGFSAGNAPALSQKNITTCFKKVNLEICPEQMAGTWAEWALQVQAAKTELPFERYLVELLGDRIKANIEKSIWQGDGEACECSYVLDDAPTKECTCGDDGVTGYNAVMSAYLDFRPSYQGNKDIKIFVDPAIYDVFALDLVNKNLSHYNPGEPFRDNVIIPGTNVEVVRTPGLATTGAVVVTTDGNLYYATDMMDNAEEFKIWFSDDNDVWRVKAKWNGGATFAFADEIMVYTYSCTPAAADIIACAGE